MGARNRRKKERKQERKQQSKPDPVEAKSKSTTVRKPAAEKPAAESKPENKGCPNCGVMDGAHLLSCPKWEAASPAMDRHDCEKCGGAHWQKGPLCLGCQGKMTEQEIKDWVAPKSTKLEIVRTDKTATDDDGPSHVEPPKATLLIDLCVFYLPGADLDKIAAEVEHALSTGGKLKPERIASVEVLVLDTEDTDVAETRREKAETETPA